MQGDRYNHPLIFFIQSYLNSAFKCDVPPAIHSFENICDIGASYYLLLWNWLKFIFSNDINCIFRMETFVEVPLLDQYSYRLGIVNEVKIFSNQMLMWRCGTNFSTIHSKLTNVWKGNSYVRVPYLNQIRPSRMTTNAFKSNYILDWII